MLVLAGGVERLAGPVPQIGVHQITTLVRVPEGLAHLTSTRKLYEQQGIDAEVKDYLAAMGVGEPVMTLARKTPAASVRWLNLAELKASRLATQALDAAQPILANGANGLNGHAFDGDPPRVDLVQASIVRPIPGPAATLEIALRYRRGGGAIEAEATERPPKPLQAADPPSPGLTLTLSAAGGEPLQLKTSGMSSCARAHPPRAVLRAHPWRRDYGGLGIRRVARVLHRRLSCPPWTARMGSSPKPAPDRAAAPPQARTTPAKP